jgi:Rps23 Pro-64 3,4-dihydroxylase Tpa1-like proline 4-hydroxylase
MIKIEKFGKIHYYKNVLKTPEGLIDLLESTDDRLNENTDISQWKEWISDGDIKYSFGYQKKIKTDMSTEFDEELLLINKIVVGAISRASDEYAKHCGINIGTLHQIYASKYPAGRAIGPHVDSYEGDSHRVLSAVLYLNNDYEGGELFFPNQNVKIKPEPGSVVVFPSVDPYYHQSLEVISGMKYAVPGFWYAE